MKIDVPIAVHAVHVVPMQKHRLPLKLLIKAGGDRFLRGVFAPVSSEQGELCRKTNPVAAQGRGKNLAGNRIAGMSERRGGRPARGDHLDARLPRLSGQETILLLNGLDGGDPVSGRGPLPGRGEA